jgi:hypothetical protein
MPLDIKLNVRTTDDCKNLVIEDITGYYDILNNPGGWGQINQSPSIPNESINVFITVYHHIAGVQYTTTIQVPESLYYTAFPFESSIEGFKMSIPSDIISTYIANQITLEPGVELPEEYNITQETVEDNIYQVVVRLSHENMEIISTPSIYSSTCNMRKDVDALLSSIDLSCKDCDQTDFDKALLAKSILEGLENA